MDWASWVSSVSTSSVLAFVGGIWFKARLEQGIKRENAKYLEGLKSEFRRDEQALQFTLQRANDEVSALRQVVLSAAGNTTTKLDDRRIEAIEILWGDVISQTQLKALAQMLAVFKMDVIIERAAKQDDEGKKLRNFAESIWIASGTPAYKRSFDADKQRPFVSSRAWALLSAYRLVLAYPVIQITAARTGGGKDMLADPSQILETIKSVLPEHSDFINQHQTAALPAMIVELEERLLAELLSELDGSGADEKNIGRSIALSKTLNRAFAPLAPGSPDIEGIKAEPL